MEIQSIYDVVYLLVSYGAPTSMNETDHLVPTSSLHHQILFELFIH